MSFFFYIFKTFLLLFCNKMKILCWISLSLSFFLRRIIYVNIVGSMMLCGIHFCGLVVLRKEEQNEKKRKEKRMQARFQVQSVLLVWFLSKLIKESKEINEKIMKNKN